MMVAVAIAGIVLAAAKPLFIDNRPRDVLIAAISTMCGRNSTVYAKGYSESEFRLLRVGMTVRQVEDISEALWHASVAIDRIGAEQETLRNDRGMA